MSRSERLRTIARSPWPAVALVAASTLVAAGFLTVRAATRPAADAAPAAERAVTVNMTDGMDFAPASVTIDKGATVTWRNTSSVPHTVTAIPGKAQDPSHVRLPEGARPFGSGNIGPGGSFSHTFTVPGAYRYFCIPHESQGMVATIRVRG